MTTIALLQILGLPHTANKKSICSSGAELQGTLPLKLSTWKTSRQNMTRFVTSSALESFSICWPLENLHSQDRNTMKSSLKTEPAKSTSPKTCIKRFLQNGLNWWKNFFKKIPKNVLTPLMHWTTNFSLKTQSSTKLSRTETVFKSKFQIESLWSLKTRTGPAWNVIHHWWRLRTKSGRTQLF